MRIIIDRIENQTAVCELESGETVNAPVSLFENISEGAVYNLSKNTASEEERKKSAQKRLNNLFNK